MQNTISHLHTLHSHVTMSRSLEGKLGIVTGASRGEYPSLMIRDLSLMCPGIGAAIAENLAAKGCNLILGYTSDSSRSATDELAASLREEHSITAIPIQADLGTTTGPAQLIKEAQSLYTTSPFRIDILINNAGVAINNHLPDITPTDFDISYRVNVLGPLLLVQAAAPFLPQDRSGRIVSLSSVSSAIGFPGQAVYGGTKAAVEAMTRTWARELAERATVNAVNPGPVLTDMYARNPPAFKRFIRGFIEHAPLMRAREGVDADDLVKEAEEAGGRPAYVEEIAGVVGMLCSAESGWCTGQVVSANGGMIMGMQ
jgi:L-xylulose reductase